MSGAAVDASASQQQVAKAKVKAKQDQTSNNKLIRPALPGIRPGPVIWLRLETPDEMCVYEMEHDEYFSESYKNQNRDGSFGTAAAAARGGDYTDYTCADFNERVCFSHRRAVRISKADASTAAGTGAGSSVIAGGVAEAAMPSSYGDGREVEVEGNS